MSDPGNTSWRYESAGKTAEYRGRSRARNRAEAALLADVLAEIELGSTLDAPCGAGRLVPLLVERGARYVGLDLAAAMLEAARESAPALVRGHLARLPLADRSFDTVVCFRFLHHLAPELQEDVVRELARVTRRSLVLTAFHPASSHRISRGILSRLRREPPARHATAPALLDRWLGGVGFTPGPRRRQGILRDLWIGIWSRR